MHEFRLPSLTDPSLLQKKPLEKTIPPNDSWAICRIFKKTNATAQRAISHSWVSPPLPSTNGTYNPPHFHTTHRSRHSTENTLSTMTNIMSSNIQFTGSGYFPSTVSSCQNTLNILDSISRSTTSVVLPPPDSEHQNISILSAIPLDLPAGMDIASMVLNTSPITLPSMDRSTPTSIEFAQPQQCSNSMINRCAVDLPDIGNNVNGATRSINFPFSMQGSISDDWRATVPWDSLPCTTEVSTNYHSTKCYT